MRVLVLCDGGGSIGVGHVMRSLALAEEAVAAGHEVVVAGDFTGAFLARQLATALVEVVRIPRVAEIPGVVEIPRVDQRAASSAADDHERLIDLVERLRPDLVHVDSYDQQGWLTGSFTQSNMEDGSFGRRPADVVVDPTFGAELTARPDDGSRWLLRGSRYTPVRRRVTDARRRRDDEAVAGEVARSVLVVMGGTDPVGLAPIAVSLLAQTGLVLDVTVVAVGEPAERVREAAAGSRLSLHVLAPVDDLPALMSRQDLVISAAGTSLWELCCLGVPMAVIWAVDNQRAGYDRVVAAGAAIGLGGPEPGLDARAVDLLTEALTDSGLRADLALAGREVVDGLGAWRVVRTWEMACRQAPGWGGPTPLPAVSASDLVARPATLQDARLLWQWRNDPDTRAGSRSPAEVPWEDHLQWLTATLGRTDRLLLVVTDVTDVTDPAGSLGTARWDLRSEGEWEVSVTVAPARRGQSLARLLLRAGEVALSEMSEMSHRDVTEKEVTEAEVARPSATDVTAYLAVVHVDNQASLRLFETSGYLPDLPPDSQGFMQFRKPARVP